MAVCRYGYILCELLLEVWFQIEVITNVAEFDSFKGREITNLGRGLALSMLLADERGIELKTEVQIIGKTLEYD